jgi:polyisoprenoid-binding protein YceI
MRFAGNAVLAFLLATLPTAAHAHEVALALAPGSRLSIEGTSNLHRWSCTAATLAIDAKVDDEADALTVRRLVVTVPVKDLHCGHAEMDSRLRAALDEPHAPSSRFVLLTLAPAAFDPKVQRLRVSADGELTVHGTTRRLSVPAELERKPHALAVRGAVDLRMTDYGVKPPVALGGLLKTGPVVTVKFELQLAGLP